MGCLSQVTNIAKRQDTTLGGLLWED